MLLCVIVIEMMLFQGFLYITQGVGRSHREVTVGKDLSTLGRSSAKVQDQ